MKAGREEGPVSPNRWKSPVRGPWLTSVFGLILLIGIPVEFITGLISYAAYNPKLKGNDPNPNHGLFGLYLLNWATSPAWLYRLTEGVHVMLGLVLVPVVLAKLWSVMPKLFAWPPWTSISQLLERLSLVLIVGGVVFEMSTGILNIDYLNPIKFYPGHFYGAWAFMAGFAVHVVVKFGDMVHALRSRRLRTELRTGLADTRPEPAQRRTCRARAGATHDLEEGHPRPRRRHVPRRVCVDRRRDNRRRHAECRIVRHALPRTGFGGESLPGEQDRRIGGDHRDGNRSGLAA